MDDYKLYYDFAKVEAELIASRGNFMLVFQSVLFSASISLSKDPTYVPEWIIILLGFSSSVVWLLVNYITNQYYKIAWQKLEENDKRIKDLSSSVKSNFILKNFSISWMMAYFLPLLISIAWLTITWQWINK